MPSDYPVALLPPLKGLNLRDDPTRLKPGECSEATNVLINEDGSKERLYGYTNLFSTLGASFGNSLVLFDRWDGSEEAFFEYNGTLYDLDLVAFTNRAIFTGLLANARIGWVPYNDYLYFGNGFDENKVIIPTYRHYINGALITSPDCSDEATTVTLVNEIKADYNTHCASATQHNTADTTNTIIAADATDYASAQTLINEIRTDYSAHRSQSGIHPSDDSYHAIELAAATNAAETRALANQAKGCINQHIGDCRVTKWGIVAPSTAATGAPAAGAELEVGAYKHVYTYYNAIDARESAPSPAVTTTTNGGNERVALSAMAISTDPQVTHKRIYRTVVAGATYWYVGQITNVTTTYTDQTADASLTAGLQTEGFAVPPATNNFLLFNDIIYMAGDLTEPARLHYTRPFYPYWYYAGDPPIYVDITITALARAETGIFMFEKNKTHFLSGTTGYDFSQRRISEIEGCTNPDGIAYMGTLPVWVTHLGVRLFDGATIQRISDLIDPVLLTKNLDNAYLVYDAYKDLITLGYAET